MAINLCCPVCYKTYKLQTLECKCGNNLRRSKLFKVRVKRPDGKWRSKQVNSLELAKKVEAKFKTQAIEEDVFDIHRAPVIDAVWKKYIHWASLNKRSWIDDRIRWELHTRHQFSVAEARKPETCGSCHLGGDHPQLEIYEASKHGQLYNAHGEDWNFEAAPDTWEPGDYERQHALSAI